MDIDNLRGLATIFCLLGFAGVVYWAYAPSRRERFEADGQLPFSDEEKEGQR